MVDSTLKIGAAQIAPIWLNKQKTLDKILSYISQAADKNLDLVAFGETVLPGYPFWIALTNGSQFDSTVQKELHAHYLANAIVIEDGDLDPICQLANQRQIAVYLGIAERATDRGGHSIYCSLVYIDKSGNIQSVHRKLQPTYEERLTWAPGDGKGLVAHDIGNFTVGGLNCWENWMPLARTALYGQGENLHVAVWPGSDYNTAEITRFIARESRSYVMSASSLMRKEDFPKNTPYLDQILEQAPDILANGGSCIASPDAEWLIKPQLNEEGIYAAEIILNKVFQERQNFDPVGHYSRPDVLELSVNRDRQTSVRFK